MCDNGSHMPNIHHQIICTNPEDKSEISMIFTNLNVLLIYSNLTNYTNITNITNLYELYNFPWFNSSQPHAGKKLK